jgi:hypothetical protein
VEVLELDHYLDVMKHRPGSFVSSTPLVQARKAGLFTPAHQAWWDHARMVHGDQEGTRALIGVLLGTRTLPAPAVQGALTSAVEAGWDSPDAVICEARCLTDKRAAVPIRVEPSVTAQVTGSAERALPSLGAYDELLEGVAA